MPVHIIQSASHLTSYHKNNGLILQFILTELFEANNHFQKIEKLVEKLPHQKKGSGILSKLSNTLVALCGSGQGYMRIFTWNLSDGILTKLKNYCALYNENSGLDSRLIRTADRTWLLALQAQDLIRAIQKQKDRSDEDKLAIVNSVVKLSESLNRLARIVKKNISTFKDDENVIFYVIRHQEKLNALFGEGFCRKQLEKMYPEGKNKVEQFLVRQYTKRGFDTLTRKISDHLSHL